MICDTCKIQSNSKWNSQKIIPSHQLYQYLPAKYGNILQAWVKNYWNHQGTSIFGILLSSLDDGLLGPVGLYSI